MNQDTTIVARHVTAIMGEARGHLSDLGAARLVIDDTHGNRTYAEFYDSARYIDFVGAAATSLDAESMVDLAARLLSVMGTNDRTQAIARAVSTYYTPRVEISA